MLNIQDSFKHQGLRRQLVLELKSKGIADEGVLSAIGSIPRHIFMDNAFVEFAYADKAFPIASGQTISQPYTVAFQTQLLGIQRNEKVLEIGTGSGYQTAVLCTMGAKVFSIERHKILSDNARSLLTKLGFSPKTFFGDGFKGLPAFAPFDKIIITCGAPNVPPALLDQLKPGGIMVIPVGENVQIMKVILKNKNGELEVTDFDHFKFVPMLGNKVR
jgi:protein-L-isoaspartate(D-aspartate) O-methyltransferase